MLLGYELVLGTRWFEYELVVGMSWSGYGLVLGTSWLGYELEWVRVDRHPTVPVGCNNNKVPISVGRYAQLVQGLFAPQYFRSSVPTGNFRSQERKFPGTFVPLNIHSAEQ